MGRRPPGRARHPSKARHSCADTKNPAFRRMERGASWRCGSGSDRNQPLLVGASAVGPLDDVRAVGGAAAVHVNRLAAVDGVEPEASVADGGDGPFLVVLVQPLPEMDI